MSRRNLPVIYEQRIRQIVKVRALSWLLTAMGTRYTLYPFLEQLNKLSGTGFSRTCFVSRARSINKTHKLI